MMFCSFVMGTFVMEAFVMNSFRFCLRPERRRYCCSYSFYRLFCAKTRQQFCANGYLCQKEIFLRC